MYLSNPIMSFINTRIPTLKRSTHAYCSMCFTNLETYGQEKCYGCLLPLNREDMVLYDDDIKCKIKGFRWLRLRIKSKFLRLVKWIKCL